MVHPNFARLGLAFVGALGLSGCDDGPTAEQVTVAIRFHIDKNATNIQSHGCVQAQGQPGTVCEVRWDRPNIGEWIQMSIRLVKNGMGGWDVSDQTNVSMGPLR